MRLILNIAVQRIDPKTVGSVQLTIILMNTFTTNSHHDDFPSYVATPKISGILFLSYLIV